LQQKLRTKQQLLDVHKGLSGLCYSPKFLESTFVEISKENKSNIVVGCIYKHPSLPVSEFNSVFLPTLLNKTSLEKKTLILMRDFNIHLLKVEDDPQIASFPDLMGSNFPSTSHYSSKLHNTPQSQ